MAHPIRVGVGGWSFDPWDETFYPAGLSKAKQLAYASRKMTAVEVNATYYSSFKPDTFAKWADAVPADFVFSLKAHRFSTVRKTKEDMKKSIDMFLGQGVTSLKEKLGPINWQFAASKTFDPADFEAFLKLLPAERDGVRLRHALEVRHGSFETPQFYELAAKYGCAIVYAEDDEAPEWPRIDQPTADFTYARLMSSREEEPTGMTGAELDAIAARTRQWATRGEVFAYFIAGAKVRNPAAAEALIARLG